MSSRRSRLGNVRFYVKDTDRKPDPGPANVNAGRAVIVGVALWAIALVGVLAFAPAELAANKTWYALTCLAGIALGIFAWFKIRNR